MENNLQPKHYYLIDASAFCSYVEFNSNESFFNAPYNNYFFYIPQFCIAEVFNTLARWHYSEKKIDSKKYKELCELFKKLIRNRAALSV